MVVKIISVDNISVEFGKNEVHRIPYIMDIIESDDEDVEIPIVNIDSRSLRIIKELLELQTTHGQSFKCESKEIQKLGTEIVYIPIHDLALWEGKQPYLDYLDSLTAEECVKAFIAADYLKCYDLMYGIGYIIGQRQINYDLEIRKQIKLHFSEHLSNSFRKIVVNT